MFETEDVMMNSRKRSFNLLRFTEVGYIFTGHIYITGEGILWPNPELAESKTKKNVHFSSPGKKGI